MITNENKEYYPIGTVVLLENAKKRIMIIGYKAKTMDKNDAKSQEIIWDYSGCIYPEGLLSSDQILLFNHSQIKNIYYSGFQDEEFKGLKEKLKKIDFANE